MKRIKAPVLMWNGNWARRRARSHCLDCDEHVPVYMLRDAVWYATGVGWHDGVLCLDCVERRLGRELTYRDFKPRSPENRALPHWNGTARMYPPNWKDHLMWRRINRWRERHGERPL
ncbi:MAG: hypothetical protein J2P48_08355 [Alphaproteobacteria bacterium]|nr:hypothetical protein [Alphaproteobacteria bacterium]